MHAHVMEMKTNMLKKVKKKYVIWSHTLLIKSLKGIKNKIFMPCLPTTLLKVNQGCIITKHRRPQTVENTKLISV